MDESFGSRYALQIALQTLKERCQQFQQRIATLEEENLKLRAKCEVNQNNNENSIPEVDALKQQITQLTEQKVQLSNNVYMVSAENHRLWTRLSKLTQANENLDSKLNRISDTLSQHNNENNTIQNPHSTLIRSKTFTQDEPHLKFIPKTVSEENDKLSLELEDISLKLISAIAKEKSELELQCSQMAEIQNSDTICINSFAFAYPNNEIENTELNDSEKQLTNLKNIKEILLQNKEKLQKDLNNFKTLKANHHCNSCKKKKNKPVINQVQTTNEGEIERMLTDEEESEQLASLLNWGTPNNSNTFLENKVADSTKSALLNDSSRMCPMCSKVFHNNTKFCEYQNHVESHFVLDNDGNFEIIP